AFSPLLSIQHKFRDTHTHTRPHTRTQKYYIPQKLLFLDSSTLTYKHTHTRACAHTHTHTLFLTHGHIHRPTPSFFYTLEWSLIWVRVCPLLGVGVIKMYVVLPGVSWCS